MRADRMPQADGSLSDGFMSHSGKGVRAGLQKPLGFGGAWPTKPGAPPEVGPHPSLLTAPHPPVSPVPRRLRAALAPGQPCPWEDRAPSTAASGPAGQSASDVQSLALTTTLEAPEGGRAARAPLPRPPRGP